MPTASVRRFETIRHSTRGPDRLAQEIGSAALFSEPIVVPTLPSTSPRDVLRNLLIGTAILKRWKLVR
jgi:hypothetical protein